MYHLLSLLIYSLLTLPAMFSLIKWQGDNIFDSICLSVHPPVGISAKDHNAVLTTVYLHSDKKS